MEPFIRLLRIMNILNHCYRYGTLTLHHNQEVFGMSNPFVIILILTLPATLNRMWPRNWPLSAPSEALNQSDLSHILSLSQTASAEMLRMKTVVALSACEERSLPKTWGSGCKLKKSLQCCELNVPDQWKLCIVCGRHSWLYRFLRHCHGFPLVMLTVAYVWSLTEQSGWHRWNRYVRLRSSGSNCSQILSHLSCGADLIRSCCHMSSWRIESVGSNALRSIILFCRFLESHSQQLSSCSWLFLASLSSPCSAPRPLGRANACFEVQWEMLDG